MQEARAASAFSHPNVAHIYEIGEAAGARFIVMEYVEGTPLNPVISSRRLTLPEILDIAIQTAEALSEAHANGITHRDIKPANMMLTGRGQVKIIDFGLAKLTRAERDEVLSDASTNVLTHPGMIMGTVRYMSPEQALGREVDHRTDIFSLGAVLYEMATGRPPFKGSSATETIDGILHSQPEPITSKGWRRGWAAQSELEIIIGKCLQKQPKLRYQGAEELVKDLRDLKQQVSPGLNLRTKTRFGWRRYRRAVLMMVVVTMAIVGSWRLAAPALNWLASHYQTIDSLAVLPFLNATGNPDLEYVADGIVESIINDVSRGTDLKVIARASVFRYKGKQVDPSVIGRDLGVRSVLIGSVLQKEDLLLFSLELTDTRDNRHIWGRQYSRKVSELLALQEHIAHEISETLQPGRLSSSKTKLLKQPTKDPEAYRLYLLGRYHSAKMTQAGLNKGIELFEQATRMDPSYAPAFLGTARAYHYASGWYFPPREAMPKAREAATRASQIDESLSEGHAAVALIRGWYDWDFEGAEREFRRALELNPSDSTSRQAYGWFLCAIGRAEEAIVELRRARELDPQSLELNAQIAWALYVKGQEQEALQQLQHTMELEPNFWLARFFRGWIQEGQGRIAEAIWELEKAKSLDENPELLGELGRVYALAGRTKEANQILHRLLTVPSAANRPAWAIAALYTGFKNDEKVLEWLERGYDERFDTMPWLNTDPRFRSLRSHSRFQALVRKIGLPPS